MNPLGIHVVRESHEGVGLLDFKCLYTTPSGIPVSISIEFKLAQHKGIKRGLTRQLPSYIRANRSHLGIFVVMWFKDEKGKFFRDPEDRTKDGLFSWLQETAEKVNKEKDVTITPILIDASIRASASEL
jgi:RNA-directed DNA polymerase